MRPLISPLLQLSPLTNLPKLDPLRATPILVADASPVTKLHVSPTVFENPVTLLLSPESLLPPLNSNSEPWVRSLVWTDFRVAVAFFVVVPLFLLIWSILARFPPSTRNDERSFDSRSPIAETVLRYMTSYWQASSLLLLTVALNIQESTLGVFAGLFAQAMIVLSLWWWKDLNNELTVDESDLIGRSFQLWRVIASSAAATGVIVQTPFQNCNGASSLSTDAWCAPWLEPPRFAASVVGLEASQDLQSLTLAGCTLYSFVLLYYVTVLLPSVGRNGRAMRPELMNVATPIGVWQRLGFLDSETIHTKD